jgi:hypothetical protein
MLSAAAVFLAAIAAQAQVVTEMTPERIREAIASAGTAKGSYSLPHFLGLFDTPYSRVAGAASSAKKKYQPFTETHVTPEMLAPEVSFCALEGKRSLLSCPVDFRNMRTARSVRVSAIVVLPVGSTDPARAIQPAKISPPGVVRCASFPLSVLSEENEVRFVYEDRVCCGDVAATECVMPLKLDGVK